MLPEPSKPFFWENVAFLNQGVKITCPKGSVLCQQHDPADKLFYVNDGRILLAFEGKDGKLQALRHVETSESFGIISLVLNKPKMGISAFTMEASVVTVLSKQLFLAALDRNVSSLENCVHYLAENMWAMGKQLNMLAFQDSYRKVITILKIRCHENSGYLNNQVNIQMTHQELADSTGLSRVTVTRVLNDLEKQLVIKKRSKCITVNVNNLDKINNIL